MCIKTMHILTNQWVYDTSGSFVCSAKPESNVDELSIEVCYVMLEESMKAIRRLVRRSTLHVTPRPDHRQSKSTNLESNL